MRTHLLDPYALGENTKPCKGCGYSTDAANVHGDPFCADCECMAEAVKAPYIRFWAALEADPELQKAFSVEDETFDSGHELFYVSGVYKIAHASGETISNEMGCFLFSLEEMAAWAIEHREELI